MADVLLTVVICAIQFVLGYLGIHVALRPPRPEHHRWWIAGFIVVGASGIFLTAWLAKRSADVQELSAQRISASAEAATKANTAATNANNAATAAEKEAHDAREEARAAKVQLLSLINQRSGETQRAILKLGTTTQESLKGIPHPRTISDELKPKLITVLSAKKGVVSMSCVGGDSESCGFANQWADLLVKSGWTIKGGGISSAMYSGLPLIGIRVIVKGEPVSTLQSFSVPSSHPANALGRALLLVTPDVIGNRDQGMPEMETALEIGAARH